MKKLIFLFATIFLVFTSCQNDIIPNPTDEDSKDGTTAIQFNLAIPQFSVITKADNVFEADIEEIELYTFDADGIFLGKAAELTMPDAQMKGTAIISTKTRIVHFVINATDAQTPAPNGILTEKDIIPGLETNRMGYWGRKELAITDLKSPIQVELIRNYAKITFKGDKYPGTTFAIANNPKSAKVAMFNEDGNKSFEAVEEVVTIPDKLAFWKYGNNDTGNDVSLSEIQYLFEAKNATLESEDTPTFVVAKVNNKFYKFQLILSAVEAYKIERNYHYEIVFAGFELDPQLGHNSYKDAADNETVANNIFADIIKYSPGIMDSKNNKIEVEKLAYQVKAGNTLSIPANYFINGVVSNSGVQCHVKEGTSIIDAIFNESAGRIEVTAKKNGEAVILFGDPKGLLKREVKISVTDGFQFTSFEVVTSDYDQVSLRLGLPAGLDRAYFPLQLRIKANHIVPVQGLIIGYETDGTPYYLYEVTEDLYDFDSATTALIEIPFVVSLSESETVTVDHTNFLPIHAEFAPQTHTITFTGKFYYSIYGCEFNVVYGSVYMCYGTQKEAISIHKGKVRYPFIAPKAGDVTLAYYIDSNYAFTNTLDVADFSGSISLQYESEPVSSSAFMQNILVEAQLGWYRLDTNGSGNQSADAETQLSYMTESGIVTLSFNYQQTTPIELPDDVELVVLSRIVKDGKATRVYKAVATVDQLLDSTAKIKLVYDPTNNTLPWM
ncbi:hypothetical protein LJC35_02245 [Parabacteroides sp. OttesenSCG-928-N08]|nr:hypothetical protein [Parabacteroides sp. OttesenSCG-928-N08]